MNVLIIANPVSGKYNSNIIEKVKNILAKKFENVSICLTEYQGHATYIASNAEADIVIAAGGDGLANEVACGLVNTSKYFAVLPFGTANVFCCEHNISLNPEIAANHIDLKNMKKINAGYADNRLFLLMAGFGYDAETVGEVSRSEKKYKLKKIAHIIKGFSVLCKNSFKKINLFLNGSDINAYHIIISVASSYGGKFKLGKIDNDKLNMFVIQNSSKFSLLKSIFSILCGFGFQGMKYVSEYAKVSGALSCQIDGEYIPINKSSIFIKHKKNALTLIY